MNKQVKHTYGGMSKDITKSRFPNTSYFDAKCLRLSASDDQSSFSLSNEKGPLLKFTFPEYTVSSNDISIRESNYTRHISHNAKDIPLGLHKDHKLVGSINIKDGIVFFTTGTIDTIWLYEFNNDNHIKLLYARKLGFSQEFQITGISNYENHKIEKIYWVDGKHQLRHLNIRHSKDNGDYEDIINIPTDNLEMVSKFKMKQPIIKDVTTGGNHTAGIIQYAYSLYRINGNTSNISSLSKQVPLNNGTNGGGDVNEKVNSLPIVRIEDIDDNYTNIIVYSIKYTSYGVLPEINIIYDQVIPDNRNVEIYDDNTSLGSISIEEFVLKLQNVKIPKHITSKDNRLFVANYEEKTFRVNLDVRAYSFTTPLGNGSPTSRVYSDVESLTNIHNIPTRIITEGNFPDNYQDTFDNVNLDYDTYKYSLSMYNNGITIGPTIGGTSKYLTYEIIQTPVYNSRNRYFKDEEIYRIGIEFYNEYGVNTKPMWIADFKAPAGNMIGLYNTLRFTWKQEFYNWLNSQNFDTFSKPVGYRLLVAERGPDDRTIITSGVATTMMFNFGNTIGMPLPQIENNNNQAVKDRSKIVAKMPSFLTRNLSRYPSDSFLNSDFRPLRIVKDNMPLELWNSRGPDNESVGGTMIPGSEIVEILNAQYTKMIQLYSPDTVFNQNLNITNGLKLKFKGLLKNTLNKVWSQELFVDGQRIQADGKGDGISMIFAKNKSVTEGSETALHDTGLIAHPGGSDANTFMKNLWYRKYGYTEVIDSELSEYQSLFKDGTNFLLQKTNTSSIGDATTINIPELLMLRLSNFTATHYKIGYKVVINTNENLPYNYIVRHNNDTIASGNSTNNNIEITVPEIIDVFNSNTAIHTISVSLQTTSGIPITGTFDIIGTLSNNNIVQLSTSDQFTNTENYNLINGPFNFSVTIPNNVATNDDYQRVTGNNIYDIYGKAEYALRGQSFTSYNKNSEFKYVNTLNSFKGLRDRTKRDDKGIFNRAIVSMGSDAVGNITIVPIDNNKNYIELENIYHNLITSGTKISDCIPYIELIKSKEEIYLGGIYGGNSYEDKLRTRYVAIGDYMDINKQTLHIESPGDTFVQIFKFLRICRSDELVINQGTVHVEEILEFPVETTIDLENRNDLSTSDWDSRISYSFDEYHKYNRVYSQPDNLRVNINNEYNVKEIDSHETNVISSKLKISGELIDNWLTLLPNESIYLDGKHGPITNLLSLNDEVYTLQDRAFSKLAINPRVQVQGDDGVTIELGTGQVLQDYQYYTTTIGCKNKQGSLVTPYGIYFYDSINKKINLFNGQLTPLSETAGLHSFLQQKDLKDIDEDKPLLNKGNALGYDYMNNDVYLTFLTDTNNFTLTYTEKGNLFVVNNEFGANHYVGFGDYFMTNLSDNRVYQNNKGEYNNYYGIYRPSKLTLIINPETDVSVVVNNIMFKSEVYSNKVDQPDKTITHIRAYNEYQDSGQIPLVNSRRGNIQRLFREWNAQVPRNKDSRERIRNPWTYLELTFENSENLQFILHDMNVSYSL